MEIYEKFFGSFVGMERDNDKSRIDFFRIFSNRLFFGHLARVFPPQVEFKHLPSGEKRFPACFLSVHRFTRNKLIEMRKEDKEASENKLAYQYPFPSPPPSRGESSIHRSLSIIHQIYSRNFTKKQSLDKCEYITIPFLVLERIFQFFEKKTRSSI